MRQPKPSKSCKTCYGSGEYRQKLHNVPQHRLDIHCDRCNYDTNFSCRRHGIIRGDAYVRKPCGCVRHRP